MAIDNVARAIANSAQNECNAINIQITGVSPDYIILNSSTTSSTKQFKITVDDTGTIVATEIIA